MQNWNYIVSLVEDMTQEIMTLFDFDKENDYDELFDILSKDLYIFTLCVLKFFS